MNYHALIQLVILLVINSHIEISYAQANTGRIQDDIASNQTYLVNTSASVLRVYVGKAGILAAMGHNHVITFHEISGQIITADAASQSSARLQIDITQSIVDDEQERKRAGAEYDAIPGESARAGTLKNMNGPRVLDIARHPLIIANIIEPADYQQAGLYEVNLEFKGSGISLSLPAEIVLAEDTMLVDSEFHLSHEQLGLIPFSAAGGLLKVAGEIRFQLHVEAMKD